jgi:hypothetical protein
MNINITELIEKLIHLKEEGATDFHVVDSNWNDYDITAVSETESGETVLLLIAPSDSEE